MLFTELLVLTVMQCIYIAIVYIHTLTLHVCTQQDEDL